MKQPVIFRKRFIPDELIELKDDCILYRDDNMLVTRWCTLKPRNDIAGGISVYLPHKGWKISRITNSSGELVHYYCDIIHTDYNSAKDEYLFTDLLADVIIFSDGRYTVVDLDELADAIEQQLIDDRILCEALRSTNSLIRAIDSNEFNEYVKLIEKYIR